MAEDCSWYDLVCKAKDTVTESVSQGAEDGLKALADGITGAAIEIVTNLGTMWVRTPTPALDAVETPIPEAKAGAFNTQVDLILSYASWIGLAVAVVATVTLGLVMAVTARRGDGSGFVTKTTTILGGAILISSAVSLGSFIVPERQTNMSGSIAFLQDQTIYLTMGLAAVSLIIAGVNMAWTHRAEPAQEVLKSLITLATVTVAGVTFISILTKGTDALATQIVDAAIGKDFQKDLLRLLSLTPNNGIDENWLAGNVMLIVVGGLLAILVSLFQLALMALRTGMLFLLAGLLPLAASFTNTPKGKQFFEKTVGWTLAFAFYKPAAAAIYALAIKLTTTGLWEGQKGDSGILQFCAGLMMVLASIAALPVLIGFLSPIMSAMGSSGSGGALGVAALGAAIPGGASRLGRSGRGLGENPAPNKGDTASGKKNPAPTAGGKEGAAAGKSASKAAGAAGGAATAGVGAAAKTAGSAIKKGKEAVVSETQAAAGMEPEGSSSQGSGQGRRGGPGGPQSDKGRQQTPPGSRGRDSAHPTEGGRTSSPTGASRAAGPDPAAGNPKAPKGSPANSMSQSNDGAKESGPSGADRI